MDLMDQYSKLFEIPESIEELLAKREEILKVVSALNKQALQLQEKIEKVCTHYTVYIIEEDDYDKRSYLLACLCCNKTLAYGSHDHIRKYINEHDCLVV